MSKTDDFILAGLLALTLSLVLFGNGISGDFVFDDTIVIVGNQFIGDLSKFFETFVTPYFTYQPRPGLYRPLTIASYSLNAFIFGFSPASFHVTNIILHGLVSYLIFVLLYKLGGRVIAFLGFLFFMFFPIHVEAVTSIVGRAEILSLLFVLVALILAINQRYYWASGAFFLGLLSKEMAIAFIPICLFLDSLKFQAHREIGDLREIWRKFRYFIPALTAYAVLRYIALGEYFLRNDATNVSNPIKFSSFLTGLWTSFKVFYLYFEKMLFPVLLSSDYSFDQITLIKNPLYSWQTLSGLFILVLLIVICLKSKDKLVRLGIFIFLTSYLVISNWIFKTGTIMAERLMYMPSLGIIVIIAILLNCLLSKRGIIEKLVYAGLAVVLVIYGYLIIDRNRDWLNSERLYASAYAAAPDSLVNQTNKAYLDFIKGNYDEAEKRLSEVLEKAPDHVPALNLAGQNYKKLGQYQKAEESWKKAIKIRDDFLRAYLSLGVLYYENGYFKSAEKVLTEAINVYPRWSEVLFLALTEVSLEKPDEAIRLIKEHFGDNPSRKELKFAIGLAYFNKGQRDIAYVYFQDVKNPATSMEDFIKTFEGSKVVLLGEF